GARARCGQPWANSIPAGRPRVRGGASSVALPPGQGAEQHARHEGAAACTEAVDPFIADGDEGRPRSGLDEVRDVLHLRLTSARPEPGERDHPGRGEQYELLGAPFVVLRGEDLGAQKL